MKRMLLALLACSRAFADPHDDYRRASDHGRELFEQGKWKEAREQYEAAYRIDPRPILLFNIASTYRREGDLVNARLYYQRYLDTGDTGEAPLAKKTIADIDAQLLTPPPPPAVHEEVHAQPAPVADVYPRAVIDRPLTLPAGMTSAGAGGMADTSDERFALVGAAYGITSRVEAGVDVALGDASQLAFGSVAVAASPDVAVRGSLSLAFPDAHFFDARAAVPLRVVLAGRLALVSTEDAVIATRDQVFLRAPIGLGYQLTPILYVTVATRPVDVELRAGSATLFAERVAVAATLVPARTIDVFAQIRVLADHPDGTLFVRLRL